MNKPVDETGFEWTQEKDQGWFQSELPGGFLLTTMQCDMYILPFLTGRRAADTKQDELLQIYVRRVNLDDFW